MSEQYLAGPLSPAQFPSIGVPSPAQFRSIASPQPKGEDTRLLLVFGSLARTPSKQCGLCLLTKLGLAQFTARLFVHRWGDDGCAASNVFDALPPHKAALLYSRPICTT